MSNYDNVSEDYSDDRYDDKVILAAAQEAEKYPAYDETQQYVNDESAPLDLFEMDNDSGMKYFQLKYAKSFTDDDEQFQNCLGKNLGTPPIMYNYRIYQNAKRQNNRRFNNNFNHQNNNNNRQYNQRW